MKSVTKNHEKSKENAVSPVIGVMLMLVVTIVIAAFVSVFAGNAFENTEFVPSAVIDVKAMSGGGDDKDQFVVTFEHLGGESIPVQDVRLYTYFSPADGSPMTRGSTTLDAYTSKNAIVPGDVLSTKNNTGTAKLLGWRATDLPDDNSHNTYGIARYSTIEIEMVHVPSQKTLFSGKVSVQ